MNFKSKYIDELIDDRRVARENKDWKLADEIRDYLETKLVFVFDANWGQEVLHLTKKYFERKELKIETLGMNKRQYVEYRIKQDINAEKLFESWLYSIRKSAGLN